MKNKHIFLGALIVSSNIINAQYEDKPLGTESVTVTNTYRPEIQDAFKINDNPIVEDKEVIEKREIKYNIFSFPVASTFVPAKATATTVDDEVFNPYFNNYALVGAGGYKSLRAELGIVEKIDDKNYIGGFIKHRSSGGGIDGVENPNGYNRSGLNLVYGNQTSEREWTINIGTNYSKFHWYGVHPDVNFTTLGITKVGDTQTYQDVTAGTKLHLYNKGLESIDANYTFFKDGFGAKESRLIFSPRFVVPISDKKLPILVKADWVTSKMENYRTNTHNGDYNYFILSAEPHITFTEDNYSVQLGAGVAHIVGDNQGNKDNSLLIYPKIKANVDLVPDIVIGYLGIDGGVSQNTYKTLSESNPHISIETSLLPTKKTYDIFAGLKGKLYHNISYNLRGAYKDEHQKALFTSSIYNTTLSVREPFEYGNTFNVKYDDVKTVSLFGELTFDLKDVKIDTYGLYNSYQTTNEDFAYNLPIIEAGLKTHVDFSPKVYADLHLYFVGDRRDYLRKKQLVGTNVVDIPPTEIKMAGYTDVNLTLGYNPTNQWTVFASGINLLNQKYFTYTNYRAQGIHAIIGAMYKFDFRKKQH